MSGFGRYILALIITLLCVFICWGLLRVSGKVEVEELALVVACEALFFVIKHEITDIEED